MSQSSEIKFLEIQSTRLIVNINYFYSSFCFFLLYSFFTAFVYDELMILSGNVSEIKRA